MGSQSPRTAASKALAEARKRIGPLSKKPLSVKPLKDVNEMEEEMIVRAIAARIPAAEVARKFNLSPSTIYDYVRRPVIAARIQELRQVVKHTILEKTATGAISGAFEVMDQAIEAKDAKSLDAATRAVLNLEKAASSASGEWKKVEVSGPEGGPVQVDARAILAQIVDHLGSRPPVSQLTS